MNDDTTLLTDEYREERLRNAVGFFRENTRKCDADKLSKLLYLLDFEHYRQSGWSVTGLAYSASANGPVADAALPGGEDADAAHCGLQVREPNAAFYAGGRAEAAAATPKAAPDAAPKFDEYYFSPREMEIMRYLANAFADADGRAMLDYSPDNDLRRMPWRKTYREGDGRGEKIPYTLALQADALIAAEPTISASLLEENAEIKSMFADLLADDE